MASVELLRTGIRLFNEGSFFDAHEALEDVWREAPRDQIRRRHLQGMVQLAVAFHHQSTNNYVGARSVLHRAMRNITGAENSLPEINFDRLRADSEVWLLYLEMRCRSKNDQLADRPPTRPALPQINFRS